MQIIIAGKQNSGKTKLARLLRETAQQFLHSSANIANTCHIEILSTNMSIPFPSDCERECNVSINSPFAAEVHTPVGEIHSKEVHTPVGEVLEIKSILGSTATDKVTGFTGIVTAHCTYLTGTPQYCITGKSIDNKPADSCWFDAERVQFED